LLPVVGVLVDLRAVPLLCLLPMLVLLLVLLPVGLLLCLLLCLLLGLLLGLLPVLLLGLLLVLLPVGLLLCLLLCLLPVGLLPVGLLGLLPVLLGLLPVLLGLLPVLLLGLLLCLLPVGLLLGLLPGLLPVLLLGLLPGLLPVLLLGLLPVGFAGWRGVCQRRKRLMMLGYLGVDSTPGLLLGEKRVQCRGVWHQMAGMEWSLELTRSDEMLNNNKGPSTKWTVLVHRIRPMKDSMLKTFVLLYSQKSYGPWPGQP